MTPLILASVDAFRAGNGMESGMVEVADRTEWIFASSLYLGGGDQGPEGRYSLT